MKEDNRIAIVDLGTNTFNLKIIEFNNESYKTLHSQKEGVGLGLGGINEGRIGEEAWLRGKNSLKEYHTICSEYVVSKIYAFGTSALRNAANGQEFVDEIKKEVGIEIQVISGQKEAELIYQGVSSAYEFEQDSLIMDIGGGSTEFIHANSNGIVKSKSFEIGVSRIFQMFNPQDPYSEADCKNVITYLEESTEPFFENLDINVLFGSSGSFETFYELVTFSKFPHNEYVELAKDEIMNSLDEVINSTQKERDENPLIIPIRKKMAPIAALKIKWIIKKLNIQKIIISPFALKEGVIESIIK